MSRSTLVATRWSIVFTRKAVALLGAVAMSGAVMLGATACKCQDDASRDIGPVRLTVEEEHTAAVDRVRFSLKTPQDYVKEAYLSIDEDNVKAEFAALRAEIEAEFAASGAHTAGVSATSSP